MQEDRRWSFEEDRLDEKVQWSNTLQLAMDLIDESVSWPSALQLALPSGQAPTFDERSSSTMEEVDDADESWSITTAAAFEASWCGTKAHIRRCSC